ncbi:MAG: ABC transporter ATP-binding protein [Christensenellaceae bacterium]
MNRPTVAKTFFKTLLKNKLLTLSLFVTVIGSVFFAVLPPVVLERAVNYITEEKTLNVGIAFLYFASIGLGGVFDCLKGVLITKFGQKVTNSIRLDMAKKLENISADYFVNTESGKTASRFINDVEHIDVLFKSGVIGMAVDLLKIIGILFGLFYRSLGLGVLMLAVIPVILVVSMHFKRKMKQAQLKRSREIAKINNFIPETVQNMRSIRVLDRKEYVKNRFKSYVDECYKAYEKTYFYESLYTPLINEMSVLIIAVMMVLSSLQGGFQAFFGMNVGACVAVISYVNKIFSPIENLGMEIQNIQSAIAGVTRVNEFFAVSEKKEQKPFDFSLCSDFDAISFENVSFAYGDKVVFDDLSFTVKNGERIALTGRTGAGKTTVYRLILGLFSPTKGSVKIFGQTADTVSDLDKRRIFGYIEQNVGLVIGSVRDQITLGNGEITEEQVVKSLKTVGLYDAVNEFEGGLDAPCKESMFSKGQLQLLGVARAIVSDPPIVLLDEITANLDSDTEKQLAQALSRATDNRTVVNITHRLSDVGSDVRIIEINNTANTEK